MIKRTEEAKKEKDVEVEDKVDAPSIKESSAIWEEIRDLSLDIFLLPNQTVSMHTNFVEVEPSSLYLTINSPAVLPALEIAISHKYEIEMVDRFFKISRKI